MRRLGGCLSRVGLAVVTLVLSGAVQLVTNGIVKAQPVDMSALAVSGYNVSVAPIATSVSGTTTQNGYRNWMSIINNNSQVDINNAAITYMSGYDPSHFDSVSSFPFATNFGTLTPGDSQTAKLLPGQDAIPVEYTLGYDSAKTTNTDVIPVGGGQQTVTVTIKPLDSRYISADNANASFHLFVFADDSIPGVTVASTTDPNNLDQGEQVQTTVDQGVVHWQLGMPQISKSYTFTATLNVPNTTGVPFAFQPFVQLDGQRHVNVGDQTGSSVTVADSTLDGATAYGKRTKLIFCVVILK